MGALGVSLLVGGCESETPLINDSLQREDVIKIINEQDQNRNQNRKVRLDEYDQDLKVGDIVEVTGLVKKFGSHYANLFDDGSLYLVLTAHIQVGINGTVICYLTEPQFTWIEKSYGRFEKHSSVTITIMGEISEIGEDHISLTNCIVPRLIKIVK